MGAEMAAGWVEGGQQATPGSTLQQNQISRLTEVKDVFRNLVSRISAYNLPTHLGLVTFSSGSYVRVSQPLTPVLLNFQHRLDSTNAGGQTALFDAIRKAKEMLANSKSKHPGMKTRIIVLTDGGKCFLFS
jgi:Mg-chelatase subunit ChlD